MLVHQNADAAATAQQLDRFSETFAALKDFQTKLAARLPNVPIDVWITDALVTVAVRCPCEKCGNSRVQNSQEPIWLKNSTNGCFCRKQCSTYSKFSRRTRSRIFSVGMRVNFTLQSKFAPSCLKCRRTIRRICFSESSSPKAIWTLRRASFR